MFKIIFDGYEEPETYATYDEALAVAEEMASNFAAGAEILNMENPGDYEEENDGDGSFTIIEIDENGNRVDQY